MAFYTTVSAQLPQIQIEWNGIAKPAIFVAGAILKLFCVLLLLELARWRLIFYVHFLTFFIVYFPRFLFVDLLESTRYSFLFFFFYVLLLIHIHSPLGVLLLFEANQKKECRYTEKNIGANFRQFVWNNELLEIQFNSALYRPKKKKKFCVWYGNCCDKKLFLTNNKKNIYNMHTKVNFVDNLLIFK